MNGSADATKSKRRRWVLWTLGVVVLFGLLLWRLVPWGIHAIEATWNRGMLKQIGLALHNYHDVHGAFPPAYDSFSGEEIRRAMNGRSLPGVSREQSKAYVNYVRRLQSGQSGFTCYASLQMPR